LIIEGLAEALQGDSLLHEMLRYHMGLDNKSGMGKLLRPSLLLFSTEELGGDPERALPAAVGLELVHNFSLIHDDIQDRDLERRGRETVWSVYGIEQAINAGDLLHSIAMAQVLSANHGDSTLALLCAQELVKAIAEMIEGQGLDLSFEREEIDIDSYMEMIDKKTGALIRCALRLGALLAGASTEISNRLVELGKYLGRAFQIRDDILGIWGKPAHTGKPVGNDLLRKKNSYPLTWAKEKDPGLQELFRHDPVPTEEILSRLETTGARTAAAERVASFSKRTQKLKAGLPFSPDGHKDMEELLSFLTERRL
jgi:geranylgeranyl diphosphate synthase type I